MGKVTIAFGLVLLSVGCASDDEVRTGTQPASAECECPLDLQIANLAVCLSPTSAFGPAHLYSSHLDAEKRPACEPWRDPQPTPREAWSALAVSSACAGQAQFCIAIWAGSPARPVDCLVARVCSAFDYTSPGQPMAVPPLGSWVAESSVCAQRYEQEGGYLEFLTESQQLGCGTTDGRGRIVPLCPMRCQTEPSAPECQVCGNSPTVRL